MNTSAGFDEFLAGLSRLGVESRREADLVIFVVPATFAEAGDPIESGVSISELSRWPQVPPHWVHLPAAIRLARTNARASSLPGWVRHSRNIRGWGDADEPAQAWVAHVRGVLQEVA